MKTNLFIALALVFLAAACAPHRTCPTYLKDDTKEVKVSKVKV